MNILILGSDGYIGHSLTIHLLKKGHIVTGLDNFSRRARVDEVGSNSLTPIPPVIARKHLIKSIYPNYEDSISFTLGIEDPNNLRCILSLYKPEAIVHLAEQPSAPYSMIDPYKASETQFENVIGTLHLIWAIKAECPDCHLIKLGTMGEYGAPDCDIPEGKIPSNCLDDIYPEVKCPMSGLLFPRTPGSFYHASKVMDTINIEFACRNWGLRSTDIMQGVVFGLNETDNEELLTRFDYDSYFGTAINRFCAQAVSGHTLTVYGEGNQTRGFLPLKDSLQCLTLAIENPPSPGEYRTLNQYEDLYSINDLANRVKELSSSLGLTPSISHISNPRNEAENHYYNPTNKNLFTLGYKPTHSINPEISTLLSTCFQYKSRIKKEVIMPKTTWR